MDAFNASNGVAVYLDYHGDMDIDNHGRVGLCGGPVVEALREFFRAEEDERLGRWRWPENPDVVVYRDREPSRRSVTIFFEKTGGIVIGMAEKFLAATPDDGYESRKAARAYFDAHPEPKPWDLAEDNDIWVLTGAGGLDLPWRRTEDGGWESVTPKAIRRRNADLITAGRRIWPEGVA